LYRPAEKAMAFIGLSPTQILRRLVPDADIFEIDSFPSLGDHWLTIGQRPIHLIQTLCAEYGAVCFYCRGRLKFKALSGLMSQDVALEFSNDDLAAPYQMFGAHKVPSQDLITRLADKNLLGWSMTSGMVSSGGAHPVFTCGSLVRVLKNRRQFLMPAVNFKTLGNAQLEAGAKLRLVWNKSDSTSPIDESMPEFLLVGSHTLHAERGRVLSSVNGVLVRGID